MAASSWRRARRYSGSYMAERYSRPMGTPPATDAVDAESALRRELYFFTLYRVLEAALLSLVLFGPETPLIATPRHPELGQAVAVGYLAVSLVLLFRGRRGDLRTEALLGISFDIIAATLAMHALPASGAGIALMLLFNIGAAALLLPLRIGLTAAAMASAALIAESIWSALAPGGSASRPLAELLMFAVSFLAIATLTNLLGRQLRASEALAVRRGVEVANLAEVSELILRRLRTGVLLVDNSNEIRLANEAATILLGETGDRQRNLELVAPELAQRLARWREEGTADDGPIRFASGLPEVVPRFTRLLAESDHALVFLDDISLVSRRAESITLATLGRFSASLAHEIRNPLAAINYAVQLLDESAPLDDADRRLLQIVQQQCQRMNGIVENVLGLARRERAHPEHVDLVPFARQFVDDYRQGQPLEQDTLEFHSKLATLPALADPRQLHQVMTTLVYNALVYGRMPGEPARVSVNVHADAGRAPVIEVTDRGPGIPEAVAAQLFTPFFTTSSHGTGLGLYIARELCRANQATLDHVPLPGGGASFRIRLPGPYSLLPD